MRGSWKRWIGPLCFWGGIGLFFYLLLGSTKGGIAVIAVILIVAGIDMIAKEL